MGSFRLISAVVRIALAVLVVAVSIETVVVRAQDTGERRPEETTGEPSATAERSATLGQFPPGVEVFGALDGSVRMGPDGEVVIEGPVSVTHKGARFQADRMTFRDERWLDAVGNVLVVWQTNRITGASMLYDLSPGEGTILDAMGQVDPEYQFVAEEVRKVGDNLVYLKKAQITTCTQPTPYWSFRVSSARVRIDGYAKMWNARFRYGKVPFLYFPFLFWPIKDGRAPGLLLPEIGTTQDRGQVFHVPLFVPLGRSADVTLTASHYTIAGTGFGADVRAVPNENGQLEVQGYWIDDKVSGTDRWRFRYEQNQTFRNGFRMLADVDSVSDFDYYADFEKDFAQTSKPNIRGLIEFSRNGRWISMNARELRNEQLFSDGTSLIQQTLPELEWRGRSRKLGGSPVYLSFESSFASI
jgi:LPS-assembly protein